MPKRTYVDFRAVKQAVSIVQILDHYGLTDKFKRSANGDTLTGPCPLHNGENPTQFRVSISKNCWHCFSECKNGGNILDFVSRKEDCTIREAALLLADWFNLPSDQPEAAPAEKALPTAKPSSGLPGTKPESKRKETSGSEDTTPNKPLGFQLQNLDPNHPYLAERGLTQDTIFNFGLGFCNKGSMAGRIAIPIFNPEGEIVAYVGRWPGDPPGDTPKYKFPPDFRKTLELFNIDRAFDEPEELPLIIVEGFFGAMWLWQHGARKVVALMGSSMSEQQERMIVERIITGARVILMLDEDNAGREARDKIVARLARYYYVTIFLLNEEGMQPENLSEDRIRMTAIA